MAKKIPGFENGGILWFTDLSTPDNFSFLPLVTGLIFWLTSETSPLSRKNLLIRMKKLPLVTIIFIVLQDTYGYEPAVYFLRDLYIYTCFLMLRSKQIVELRRRLGWPFVPVTASGQQRIMARVISLMREIINVVRKKDKK
ncbi:hypothetical protein EUTSA_v10001675mg [Eutrema salsugineum]|uniref:Uncharacterized protein n=1 Tax=Eutrema salsugineum TaxID=72664 RepID=V4L6K6_EUTSA|nr:hypothetical protein EUTSA_v10001675mg [Eutrema salsugineum]